MNDPGGHGGDYPPGAPPAPNELPSPGRPVKRRQVRTRLGGVGDIAGHLTRAGARSALEGDIASTQPPPDLRERVVTEQAMVNSGKVPPRIDSHHMLAAMKADAGGQGPGLVVVVTHASGRERTEVFRTTEVAIGRDRNSDLVLTGDGISRRHALLTLGEDNTCTIIDLGSTNGTFVNEQPIENSPTELTQKDFVTLGEFALRVRPFGEEASVDPSTMQFDVPAPAVIVTNVSPAAAATPPPPPMVGPRTEPPPHSQAPRTQPPPRRSVPPPPGSRRPREQLTGAGLPAAGTQPAIDSQSPPGGSPHSGELPKMKTAEMSMDDFEPEQGQGTMAMLDASQLPQRESSAPEARPPIAPPVSAASRGPIAPPVVNSSRGPIAPPVVNSSRGPIAPPVSSSTRGAIAPPQSVGRPPSAPPVRAPEAVEAEPLDIMNEMTVSEQQTRVKEISDFPPPAFAAEIAPSSVVPSAPTGTMPPPGIVVTRGSAPPLPADASASQRPRGTPNTAGGLPQTGPRSRPIGEPVSKTPIGMPAPPSRPADVVSPQRSEHASAVSQRDTPRSGSSGEPRGRDVRDEPSMGPDSVVVAGRVTTDSSAALESLLADPAVTRVSVHVRRVDVERKGVSSPHDGFDFATEAGLVRAVERICEVGGVAVDESVPYTRGVLSSGWELFIVRPPAAPNGQLVQLRRVSSVSRTLADVAREGWLSEPMASLLRRCLLAHCNVLIVSERDDDAETMVGALASTLPTPPLWVVRDSGLAPKGHPAILLDPVAPAATLDACADLSVDQVLLPRLRLDGWQALLRVVRRGRDGVVARLRGPTVAAALDRTAAGLSALIADQEPTPTRVTPSVATFRAWLSASFTLAIEIGRIRDGAPRVLRIVELTLDQPTELFAFNPDPAPRGTFEAVNVPCESRRILELRGLWDD